MVQTPPMPKQIFVTFEPECVNNEFNSYKTIAHAFRQKLVVFGKRKSKCCALTYQPG